MMFIPVTQFPLEFLTCEASHLPKCLLWKSEPIFFQLNKFYFLTLSFFISIYYVVLFSILFRDSVKAAFQSVPRRFQADTSVMRLNSCDCSNEVEDDMLPWIPEDFIEDSAIVTSQ